MAAYKKLGLDRLTTASQAAFGAGSGAVVTEDITRGTVVQIETDSKTGTAEVGARRTGAIPISCFDATGAGATGEFVWSITDGTLTLTVHSGSPEMVVNFWVF